MHSHGNPKGDEGKNFAAGQPCKFGECNERVSEDNLDGGRHFMRDGRHAVVPANAGTHTPWTA